MTKTTNLIPADATCREHGVPAWRCCDDHPGRTIVETSPVVDDHPDFSIVEVKAMGTSGRDGGDYYMITARLWSSESGLPMLSTWLGIEQIDGTLSCVGWDTADQWIDATADRVLGTEAAVALGQRILAAAEVRS